MPTAAKPDDYTLEWFEIQRKNKSAHSIKADKHITLRPHQTEGAKAIVKAYNADLPSITVVEPRGHQFTYGRTRTDPSAFLSLSLS